MNVETVCRVLHLFSLGVVVSAALPSPGGAQTLHEIYRKAQQEDTQYRVALKSLAVAQEKVPQARAGLLPQVSLTGNSSKQEGETSFSDAAFVSRNVNSWSWNVQLTQPLFRWGNWVSYKQASAQVEVARAQLSLAEQDLMVRTAQVYFDVMLAKENIRVSTAQLYAVHEQLVLATRNFEVGNGIITDVHEAKAKKGVAQAQRVAAINELASKQAELERILGDAMTLKPGRLSKGLPVADESSLNEWIHAAQHSNPQVKIQLAALEVAKREVSKNSSAHLPSLDMTLSKGTNFNSASMTSPADLSTRVNSQQIGVQLVVPLFAGGSTQSKVRESILLQEKVRDELSGAQRNATSQARIAVSGVLNGQAQVDALEAAVESGERAVEANKIGFKIGTRINPDVLNAEQQLYASLRDLMKARVEVLLQGLKLKASAGALQEEDLIAVDTLLEFN